MENIGRRVDATRDALIALYAIGVVVTALLFGFAASRLGGHGVTAALEVSLTLAGIGGAALLWNRSGKWTISLVVAVALAARLMLLPWPPLNSNDLYRYLWDGQLLLHGIDPYVVAPEAPSLQALRTSWLYPFIDWRSVPTLYPPFDLALFALGATHAASVVFMKTILLVGDLATIGFLAVAVRNLGLPLGRVALYAWNPLVITEFALNGHEESWAIAWVVATLLALQARAPLAAGVAAAGAILTKLYPAAFVPVLFWGRATWSGAAWCLAIVVAAYAPFFLWNRDVLGFLHSFAFTFHFNDTLNEAVGTVGSAAIFAAAILLAVVAGRRGVAPVTLVLALEIVYLVVSPNVYPWYVTVFAALLPMVPGAFTSSLRPLAYALVAWTALAPLAYLSPWVFPSGSLLDALVRCIEYAPLVAALLYVVVRDGRRGLAILTGAVALSSCAPQPNPAASAMPPDQRQIAAGANLYAHNCAICHSPTRTSFIGPDLTHVSARRSATDLAHHIATLVPVAKPLSPANVRALVAYFNSLNERLK